jgi:hypothetical protein
MPSTSHVFGATLVRVRRRALTGLAVALAIALLSPAAAAAVAPPATESPLLLDSHRSLYAQFGYAPDYQLNVPSFDARNAAHIRSRTATQDGTRYVYSLRDGSISRTSIIDAARRLFPRMRGTVNAGGWGGESVEADTLGRLYTLLEIRIAGGSRRNLLLYSVDSGLTWEAQRLPFAPPRLSPDGHPIFTTASEHLAGWNQRPEPPLIAVWRPVGDWPGNRACRMELFLVQPRFEGGQLVLPDPVLVSDRALGMVQAAGGASFAATVGATTYVVWTEVAEVGAPSAPTFVAAYDQATGTLGAPVLAAPTRPINDDHATPGIVADGEGVLHVVTGSHNLSFMYTHTVAPADVTTWTPAVPVLASGYVKAGTTPAGRGCQTYVSLACTRDNALVLVFRQWRQGVDEAFGGGPYQPLSIQRLEPGGTWSEPRRLVYCVTHPGYAQYYQKMTIDRLGRLYLSLSYFRPNDWPRHQRTRHRFHHRMVLISEDGGLSWRFATLSDFLGGVAPA